MPAQRLFSPGLVILGRLTGRVLSGLPLALIAMLLAFSLSATASGQRQKDPLTEEQTDQLREQGDRPLEKIKLYLTFIDERTTELNRLSAAGSAATVQNRDAQIHNLYEEFTRLTDELQDNMDSFEEQHADMRKVLKTVVERSEKWVAALNQPPANGDYDFVRKTALAAQQSVHDDAKQMLDNEERYFAQQKKDKNEKEKEDKGNNSGN